MAGSFLCCLYTRSRWSDFQHSNLLATDPDDDNPHFLELSIGDFKTKSANAWRGGLLAAVAPALGVVEENWVVAWLRVRAEIKAHLSEGSSYASSRHGRAGDGETTFDERGVRMGAPAAGSNWFGPEGEEDFFAQCKGDNVVVSGKVRGGDLSEGNLGCPCVSLEIGDPVF